MGCASSAQFTSRFGFNALQSTRPAMVGSVPKDEVVLKDLPEVVEKVIKVLNKTEPKLDYSNQTLQALNEIHDYSGTTENINNFIDDTDSESSEQDIVHGFLTDNKSSYSKLCALDHVEEHCNNMGNILTESLDDDSLRTSSSETEIEEAFANSNDRNPPTPVPTFSELKDLAMNPINELHMYTKPEGGSLSQVEEDTQKIYNCSDKNSVVARKQLTEWEMQADVLATTQKYNPIEAMRKLRENRSGSTSLNKRDSKQKVQHYYEEDMSEFFEKQSRLRYGVSSARSERELHHNSSEHDSNSSVNKTQNDDHKKEVIYKNTSDYKRKDTHLMVSQNGKGIQSPSLYKVRERCVVCCNKYKN